MTAILADPSFYVAGILAVVLVGLSKGGLGGAMALLGVPVLGLAMPPVQAAAILLPVLLVMDAVSLWAWRGYHDRRLIMIMLPGAFVGIALGWMTAAVVTADHVRLIVGVITLLFFLRWVIDIFQRNEQASEHHRGKGFFWGTIAGFTSFVAHAGGPPYQIYALPLKHDPKRYTGTSVIFFAVVNAVKVVPYFALGQFDTTNLVASAMLMPIAPVATFAGAWIVKRMRPEIFYPFMYIMVLIVSLKLIQEGVAGLWS